MSAFLYKHIIPYNTNIDSECIERVQAYFSEFARKELVLTTLTFQHEKQLRQVLGIKAIADNVKRLLKAKQGIALRSIGQISLINNCRECGNFEIAYIPENSNIKLVHGYIPFKGDYYNTLLKHHSEQKINIKNVGTGLRFCDDEGNCETTLNKKFPICKISSLKSWGLFDKDQNVPINKVSFETLPDTYINQGGSIESNLKLGANNEDINSRP